MNKFVKVLKPIYNLVEGDILEYFEEPEGYPRYKYFSRYSRQDKESSFKFHRGFSISADIVNDNLGDYFGELTDKEAEIEIVNKYTTYENDEGEIEYGYSVKPEDVLEEGKPSEETEKEQPQEEGEPDGEDDGNEENDIVASEREYYRRRLYNLKREFIDLREDYIKMYKKFNLFLNREI